MYAQPCHLLELAAVSSPEPAGVGSSPVLCWGTAACPWAAAGTGGALQAALGDGKAVSQGRW